MCTGQSQTRISRLPHRSFYLQIAPALSLGKRETERPGGKQEEHQDIQRQLNDLHQKDRLVLSWRWVTGPEQMETCLSL